MFIFLLPKQELVNFLPNTVFFFFSRIKERLRSCSRVVMLPEGFFCVLQVITGEASGVQLHLYEENPAESNEASTLT